VRTQAPKQATLWADGGWIHIRSPFIREYVDALKAEISSAYRRWNPLEKTWSVDVSQLELLIEISERYFTVNVIEQAVPEVIVEGGHDAYSELLSGLPNDVLKKVYRTIALECHPDKGADPKLLSTANVAWEKIKKLRNMR
jgi:hypothetical protein